MIERRAPLHEQRASAPACECPCVRVHLWGQVHKSEVFLLICTPGVLTRPWCLLEVKEAMEQRKPIVLLKLTSPDGRRFSFEETHEMLDDLEGRMPALNPYCARARLDLTSHDLT